MSTPPPQKRETNVRDDQPGLERARQQYESMMNDKKLGRRGFLAASGMSLAAFLAACGSDSGSGGGSTGSATAAAAASGPPTSGPTSVTYVKGGTLNIYSWPDYFAPASTKDWKGKTGAKLNIASYESNDELFAKLSTAAARNYDIVIPTSSFVAAMAQKGMLQKLDQEKIPWQNIDKSLLGKVFDPNNEYSIPKDFGTSGVIYDPVKIGGDITTWQDFIDAAGKPGVTGKVRYSDDAQGGLGPGLWTLGFNYDTKDLAQWTKAADLVKSEIVPHVKQIGDTFNTDPITSGQLAMTTADSSVARRALLKNSKLKWVLPKPHTELWVDNYALTKNAADTDAAYSFIQHMLQPDVQIAETSTIGYAYVLPGLEAKLKSFKHGDVVFPTAAQFEYLQNSVIHPDIQGKIQDLWSKVKASA
jgi:spermidine/putrescine transport system substrate-binding protein